MKKPRRLPSLGQSLASLLIASFVLSPLSLFPREVSAQTTDASQLAAIGSQIAYLQSLLQSISGGVSTLFGAPSASAQAADITTGLVGYWSFDAGSGTTAADSSGSNNTGTLTNGPTWTTSGKIAGGINFDGVDDRVSLSSDPIGANTVTICAWINTSSLTQWQNIVGNGNFLFGPYSNGNRLIVSNNNGTVYIFSANNSLTANQWNHACVVRLSTGTATLYVNGVQSGTSGSIGTAANGFGLGIGDRGSSTSLPFRGMLDEVRIYNRALTAADVLALYNYTGTPVNSPPTITSFTASPTSITQGNSSTLSWSTTGNPTPTLSINNGVGTVTGTSVSVSPSVTTTYTLTATNSQGTANAQTTLTVTASDTTPPTVSLTAPSNGAIVSSNTTVSVTANDNIGVAGVQFLLDASNLQTEDTSSPYSISWDTTTATNGSHTLSARARDAAGNTTTSSGVTVTVSNAVDATPPSTPTNLQASAVSATQINLTWTSSTDNVGVTGYKVERCQGTSCTNFTQIGTPNTTSFADATGLSANTTYRYQVRANDAAGNNSGYSAIASAATQAVPPPGTYPWSGIIDPQRAVDWSQAGVIGGIPNRTTICATFNPGATAAQINSAIQSCPSGQVVKLNAGTYNLTAGLTFAGKNNVTLRGAGPDQTKLKFTGNDSCQGGWAVICIPGNNLGYYAPGPPTNVVNWTGGYAQGTTQVTLSGTTGLSVGMYIVVDQLNDASDTGNIYVCSTTACTHEGGGGNARPSRGNRQMTLVTAINGNTVTISPGIAMPNFRSSQSPQAWWGSANSLSTGNGVEDLSVDNNGTDGGANILLIMTHNSWVKGVRSINAPSPRASIEMYQSAHCTVRDSYVVGSQADAGHSTNYGIEMFGTANVLVENNIGQHRTPLIIANGDVGSVYGYNFAVDMHYDSPLSFMQLSNYSHEVGNGMNLHEGNSGIGIDGDIVHGTSNLVTAFRNYMVGWETGKTGNTNPVHIYSRNRYYNFVGNVFGKSGYHNTYQGTNATSIWVLGDAYNTVPSDPLVASTALRWGNYDTVSAAPQWQASEVPSGIAVLPNPVPSSQTLPASMYLSAKPSWWGSMPWPAVGPDVSGGNIPNLGGLAYKIPAQVCWEGMPADGAYAGDPASVKIFTPATCYAAAPPDTTAPSTPTNLQATAQSSSQINLTWSASTDNIAVTGYKVERCQGASCSNFAQIATPSTNSFSDTGLTANTTYRYQVRANDAAGNNSGYSTIATATTQASGQPLQGDLNGDHTVNALDWSIMNSQWFTSNPQSDINADGIVNSIDFGLMNRNWGQSA